MLTDQELTATFWRKSTYSDGQGGSCVEVADRHNTPGVVPVRDSKAPQGPVIVFRAAAWSAFVSEVKTNRHS